MKFEEEFEKKLLKLRIKTRFVKAVKVYAKRELTKEQAKWHVHYLSKQEDWRDFINGAFEWAKETGEYSQENSKFWISILNK